MKGLHGVVTPTTILPGSTRPIADHRYEVWGVINQAEPGTDTTEYEQIDPEGSTETAEFWSIYEHTEGVYYGCEVLHDFPSRERAIQVAESLSDETGIPAYDWTRKGYQ